MKIYRIVVKSTYFEVGEVGQSHKEDEEEDDETKDMIEEGANIIDIEDFKDLPRELFRHGVFSKEEEKERDEEEEEEEEKEMMMMRKKRKKKKRRISRRGLKKNQSERFVEEEEEEEEEEEDDKNHLGTLEVFEPEFYKQMRESWKGINMPKNREGEMDIDKELRGVNGINSTRKTSRTKKKLKRKQKIKEKEDEEKIPISSSTDEDFRLRTFPITLSSLRFSSKEKRRQLKRIITKISKIFKLSTLLLQDYYFLAKNPIPPRDVLTRVQGVYLAKTEKRKPSAAALPNDRILARLVKNTWDPTIIVPCSLLNILKELNEIYISSISQRNFKPLFKSILKIASLR